VGKRCQVAGAAEAAVLVHDWRQSRIDHRDVTPQRLLTDTGATGGKSGDPQQHQRPYDLALDLGSGTRGV
jgi:hypothetical protein